LALASQARKSSTDLVELFLAPKSRSPQLLSTYRFVRILLSQTEAGDKCYERARHQEKHSPWRAATRCRHADNSHRLYVYRNIACGPHEYQRATGILVVQQELAIIDYESFHGSEQLQELGLQLHVRAGLLGGGDVTDRQLIVDHCVGAGKAVAGP